MASARFKKASTASTKASAIASFERFPTLNSLSNVAVLDLMNGDESGNAFVRVMDRYALHLATVEGTRGRLLASGTALLYYGAVKNHFYDIDPTLQKHERKLKTIADLVDKAFKRKDVAVKQAPPCTRQDLKAVVPIMYAGAGSSHDYWDAALVILMWHLFGRSSDMVSLHKASFSVHPGGALNVRSGRLKTGLACGMVLCPVHAFAVACISDIVPSTKVFRQLPLYLSKEDEAVELDEMPLLEFLQDHIEQVAVTKGYVRKSPGVHAHINRLLKRVDSVASPALGITAGLSSHSFRRGGAQAANFCPKISLQWILDRGGWELSAMNKGFHYIFNSTSEDQQVAMVMSGWQPDEVPWVPSVHMFDAGIQARVRMFKTNAFHLASTPDSVEFNFRGDVLDMFIAVLIYHYPDMVKMQPNSLYHRGILRAL